ncbi:MAG: alkaline phosphatase D family protein [Chitinophagales bacterium]
MKHIKTIFSSLLIFTLLFLNLQNANLLQAQTANTKIAAGLMQAHTTENSTTVWLMTQYAQKVSLDLYDLNSSEALQKKELIINRNDWVDGYFPCLFTFENLEANTTYVINIKLNDVFVEKQKIKTFHQNNYENFSFLTGSCTKIADNFFKYWSQPGINNLIFKKMQKTNADFNVWIGDNSYLRNDDFDNPNNMMRRHIHTRLHKPVNKLIKTRPNYATWDDHDYGPNNADKNYAQKDVTLDLFQQFWGNAFYGTKDTKGVFSNFTYQDAEIFLLDNRYHKSALSDKNGSTLGIEQLEWFKKSLLESKATFKIVMSGVQFLSEHGGGEGFKQFPKERQEILDFIAENDIKGIIWVSGDRHVSELYCLKRPDTYDLYEVTTSPISSETLNFPFKISSPKNPLAVKKTKYWYPNFAHFSIRGEKGDRLCEVKIINKWGKKVWSKMWHENDLK